MDFKNFILWGNIGIRHMQGTSAFIECIGPRYNLKRHSCRGCLEYFDGICKIKKYH